MAQKGHSNDYFHPVRPQTVLSDPWGCTTQLTSVHGDLHRERRTTNSLCALEGKLSYILDLQKQSLNYDSVLLLNH